MTQSYDASAPPPPERSARQELAAMRRGQAQTDLWAAIGQIEELAARQVEDEAEPGAEVVQLLEEITGADDAPLTFASLNNRVRQGFTSWSQFWAAPQDHADGARLFAEVLNTQARNNAEVAAAVRAESER